MNQMTVTEALAEINVINKRMATKRQNMAPLMFREEVIVDPVQAEGGSREVVKQEFQALTDLGNQIIKIRAAIQQSNHDTALQLGDTTMNVADWLTWRREVAPGVLAHLQTVQRGIINARQEAQRRGLNVQTVGQVTQVQATPSGELPRNLLVNVDEQALAKHIEDLEAKLATLDGKLSLLNATTTIQF